jgi:hypothetical protein
MAVRRQPLAAVLTVAFLAFGAWWCAPGFADSAPIQRSSAPPWSDPAHHGPLELLLGRVAGALAGRPVSVRCEDPAGWRGLTDDADGELGFVPVDVGPGGSIASDASVVELSPAVCGPLQTFASASGKPTKCSVRSETTKTVWVTRRVTVHEVVAGASSSSRDHVVVRQRTLRVKRTVKRTVTSSPGPCFVGGEPRAGDNAFWSAYADTATALLAVAHETIHLTQDRSGTLLLPPSQAESEAQCVGMQRMAYVAEQLGDTDDDAEAIAQYAYDDIYPNSKGTVYWSAACVPGGALDRRQPGARAWP